MGGGGALGTTLIHDPLSLDFNARAPPLPAPRRAGRGSEHPHPLDGYLWAETKSVGWDLGLETGDPPERARPSWGLKADKRLLVLRMPVPSQTYLQPHSGDSYTHRATQSLLGWRWGGVAAASPRGQQ